MWLFTIFFPVLYLNIILEIRSRFSVKCYSQKVHQENTYMASTRLGVNELCQVEDNRAANSAFYVFYLSQVVGFVWRVLSCLKVSCTVWSIEACFTSYHTFDKRWKSTIFFKALTVFAALRFLVSSWTKGKRSFIDSWSFS